MAVDVLGRVDPADAAHRRADLRRRSLHRIMMFCAGEAIDADYVDARRGGGELRRRRPSAVRLGRSRPTPAALDGVPRGDHRRRPRRDLRRDPARTGRDPVHRVREERRRRRHLVREHLPRPAGRRAQPLLLVLVRAQPRLVRLLRPPRRARRLHRALRDGVRGHSRTSGSAPRWSPPTTTTTRARWTLRVRGRRRPSESVEVNAVISAVGMLNRPSVPELDGLDTFAGPWFHSSRWDHDVDLRGKRVAVVGTGASAMQFVPAIAPEVEHLTIFQRSRHWVTPNPGYHRPVTDAREVAVPPTCRSTRAGTGSCSSGTAPTASIRRSGSTPTGRRPTCRSAGRTRSCGAS